MNSQPPAPAAAVHRRRRRSRARYHSGRHGATVAVDVSMLAPACVRPPTTSCPSDVIAAGAAASCSPVAC
eukprot:65269-Prymnesium_polylepis.1